MDETRAERPCRIGTREPLKRKSSANSRRGRGEDRVHLCDDCSDVNVKSHAAFESQSADRIAKSEVAEETMSAMVKLAKDPLEAHGGMLLVGVPL